MRIALIAACVLQAALAPGVTHAQARPPVLDEVGVTERVGERVPRELWFSDTVGRRIQLGELFDGTRPVLLVLSYVRCRLLCSVVLRGAVEVVRAMPLALGRDYRVVIVSIDPREEAASAAARTRELQAQLGDTRGLHYLVGAERPVRELADSLGFRYAWDARSEQYAHPAVVFVLAPDGTIVRYLHGVRFDPGAVAGALRGAARGELAVPSAIAESVLACFRFDPAARARRDQIELYLRVGSIIVMALLGSSLLLLFLWERRRGRLP